MEAKNVLQGRRKVKKSEVQILEPRSPALYGIFWADQNNYYTEVDVEVLQFVFYYLLSQWLPSKFSDLPTAL